MGLQDRDYMRERRWRDLNDDNDNDNDSDRPRHFAPPEPTLRSTLQIILFWLIVALALWKAWGWWEAHRLRTPRPFPEAMTTAPRPPQPHPEPRPPATAMPPPREAAARTYPQATWPTAPQVVTKCVANGRTSYSDAGCASSTAQATQLDIHPAQNLAQGLPPEQRAAAMQSLLQPPQPQPVYAAADPALQIKAVCQALEEKIRSIDTRTRQPLSAGEQDYWSAQRKEARDEQFRLRC